MIAIRSKRAIGQATLQYVHHDHLGSVTAITNDDGSVAERQSFGAFGKRAKSAWQTDPKDRLYKKAYATDRGYTGQEQLDNLKLVNFHARLYDPVLGRFISPDSVVQFPDSTQGLNRYTYVNNNPLSYTDPDGHCIIICSTAAIYAAVVGTTAAAVGEITHNALVTQIGFAILGAATGNIEAASAVGFGAGFTESGGNLKAGLYAAATAAAFYEVGSAFQVGDAGTESGAAAQKFGQHAVLRYETHVVADGLVGGVSSEVMGGGFKSGFIGAGFGEAAGGLISKAGINSIAGHVTASALIGGTASELSGGKFANGAATAAFAAGFNACEHGEGGCGAEPNLEDAKCGAGLICGSPPLVGRGRLVGGAIGLIERGLSRLRAALSLRGGLTALSKAGQAADRGGLTRAGRALAKHGGREGSVFPRPTGNPAAINQQGQAELDGILGNVNRTDPNKFGGMDYYGGGRAGGARYDGQGNFMGFLEP